ncbi:MAG: TIGR01777 family oxidoreductase [Syntrophothermus sp.]
MSKKVVITGASGLIGRKITEMLIRRGDEVTVLSRSPEKAKTEVPGAADYVKWEPYRLTGWEASLEGKDAVIHLAGAPLMDKRWTDAYKRKILESRRTGTRLISEAVCKSARKPEVLISSSAIGYYGTSENKVFTESDQAGSGFLADVCRSWEAEALAAAGCGVRVVTVRTGIVLDKNEGALKKMMMPFKLLSGGPLGKGTQGFPWIHINDIAGIYLFAMDNPGISGALNGTAPVKTTMNDFASALGKTLQRPSWFRVPEFLLEIGVGEGAETIIKVPFVVPERVLSLGYKFKFSNLDEALKDIINR